jgi:PIN domain nuclease of toxin-antitoxin system
MHCVAWKRPGKSDLDSVLPPDLGVPVNLAAGETDRELVLRFAPARGNAAGLDAAAVVDRVARSEINGKRSTNRARGLSLGDLENWGRLAACVANQARVIG